ncbi:MAG TPA: LysR substrate-binding domain-containing protein [Kofleriaceae bacterium]|nr:LysR substrate-binding domain-containing protein [Kofleriaceae bacterium]
MEPSSLADLEALVQVAEAGTLARAARFLGLSPSALSRRLTRLEARLGVPLAVRTTRSLALTEEGRRLVARAGALLAELRDAEDEVRRATARPSGTLIVSASTFLGQHVVAPVLARFIDEHPEVRARLLLEDRYVDLVKEGIDLAIRIGTSLSASTLLARRIGTQERWLCAAPALLARAPAPRTLEELGAHRLLDLEHVSDRGRWVISGPGGERRVKIVPRVESSSLAALHAMALAGAGIVALPTHVARADIRAGRLVRVLGDHQLPTRAIWLVRARGRALTPAMTRFAAALEPVIREGG